MAVRKNMDKWSLGYFLIKNFIARPSHRLYYNRIEVHNSHLIPKGQPVIFTPNHQNALMDAMAIVIRLNFQSIFLTRADIFEHPIIESILNFLKMLPIFRIRDGRQSLQRNEEIFNASVQIVLNKRSPLAIFPEGNHSDKRQLRNMVKGVFRIAFKAQEAFGNNPGVKLIPIGLDYEDYYKLGQNLFINIGEPIEVSDFWNDYEKAPAVAINKLREKLSEEIKSLMIHISSEEYYDTILGLREIARGHALRKLGLIRNSLANEFIADKYAVEKLEKLEAHDKPSMQKLSDTFRNYSALRDQYKLRNWLFTKKPTPLLINVLLLIFYLMLSPLLLLGLFNNWPAYIIPPIFAAKVKDPQMKSTFSWGLALAIEIIYYPILMILGFVFLPDTWMKLVYIPLIPLSGFIALKIRAGIIKNFARIRLFFLKKTDKNVKQLLEIYTSLAEDVHHVISG